MTHDRILLSFVKDSLRYLFKNLISHLISESIIDWLLIDRRAIANLFIQKRKYKVEVPLAR